MFKMNMQLRLRAQQMMRQPLQQKEKLQLLSRRRSRTLQEVARRVPALRCLSCRRSRSNKVNRCLPPPSLSSRQLQMGVALRLQSKSLRQLNRKFSDVHQSTEKSWEVSSSIQTLCFRCYGTKKWNSFGISHQNHRFSEVKMRIWCIDWSSNNEFNFTVPRCKNSTGELNSSFLAIEMRSRPPLFATRTVLSVWIRLMRKSAPN